MDTIELTPLSPVVTRSELLATLRDDCYPDLQAVPRPSVTFVTVSVWGERSCCLDLMIGLLTPQAYVGENDVLPTESFD